MIKEGETMFTCIECNNSYSAINGDTDERTCNECMDREEE